MNSRIKISKNKIWLFFFILILLGAGLRFYNLGTESLWLDESYSVLSAGQDSINNVITTVNNIDYHHPPLYFILLHFWINSFGKSEFSLRSLSAIFSVLSLIMIFFIASELFNKEVGLIATLIASISILDILYSQEVRSYAFFSFLTLASMYSFIKILKSGNALYYLIYFLSSLAMIYTLPFGFIVLFLQNLFIMIFCQNCLKWVRKLILDQLLIFLFFLPEIPTFFKMFKSSYIYVLVRIVEKYGAPSILKNIGFISVLLIFLLLFFVFFTWFFKKNILFFFINLKFERYKLIFILFLALVGMLYFYMTPILIEPIFLTRYSLFLMPFLYIFIALGISKFKNLTKIVTILIIILLSSYTLSIYYPKTTKEDWRGAAKYIEENSNKSDLIFACEDDMAFNYYYLNHSNVRNLIDYNSTSEIENDLIGRYYWLIVSNHKKSPICVKILEENNDENNKTFKGIIVYHLKWTS